MSAGWDDRVVVRGSVERTRGLPVVVEGVGGGVVGVVPGTRGDPVPPGVAVLDLEAFDPAADIDGRLTRYLLALISTGVAVVGPRVGHPAGGLPVGRRRLGRRRRAGRGSRRRLGSGGRRGRRGGRWSRHGGGRRDRPCRWRP